MPPADITKIPVYHTLESADSVQKVAEALCAHLVETRLAKAPRCQWHVNDIADTSTVIAEASPTDSEEGQKAAMTLIKEAHYAFAIELDASELAKMVNDQAAMSVLAFAGLRIRVLLAESYAMLLDTQLEKSHRLQKVLFDISNLVYSEHDTGILFKKLHGIIASLVYAENFFIVRFNDLTEIMHFLYYADSLDREDVDPETEWTSEQMAGSITLAMLRSKQPAWGSSQSLLEKFNIAPELGIGPDSQDWLGLPMLENGRVVGGIVLQSYLPEMRYRQADLDLLTFVAEHIQQSLSRRSQTDELEQKVRERTAKLSLEIHERQRSELIQSALFSITRLASQSGSIEQFYPAMHEIVGQLLEAKNFYIALLDETGTGLHFPYYIDEYNDDTAVPRPISNGLTEWVLKKQAPVLLSECDIEALKQEGLAVIRGALPKCWLGVPLISHGRAIGVITVQSYESKEAYSKKDQDLLMFVGNHIAQSLEKIESSNQLNKANTEMEAEILRRTMELELSNQALREQIERREKAESKLKYDAMHDQLTGLANRNQLYIRLRQSLNEYHANPDRLFAVFFIDLDRFKVINDSMGHWVGDELLKIVASRIQSCLRKPDLVARLGGDEFAVILNRIRNISEARLVATRMLHAFTEPTYIQGKELFISPSIGIAISHLRHQEPDEILRDSDIALYRSKELGRNRFTFFDDALHQSALNTLIIEGDLRRALTRSELLPFYQPLVDLKSGKVLGFEALMRWKHPQRGLLLPSDFSEIAKETGLIEQIDWVIYEQVCRDLPVLLQMGEYASINVSPRHLGHENFADRLIALIAEYGIAPANVNIEITEDALIEHPDLGLKLLSQLKQAGIRISLDDFGTGYSSFSYLHRYPLDCLKIDRSFLATLANHPDNKTMHLVQAIQSLGISLGLAVIAEGVETNDQSACLQQIGIALGQGNLYSKPVAIEDVCKAFSHSSA